MVKKWAYRQLSHERGAGQVIEFIKGVVELLGYFSQPVFSEEARKTAKRRKDQDKDRSVRSVTELLSADQWPHWEDILQFCGEFPTDEEGTRKRRTNYDALCQAVVLLFQWALHRHAPQEVGENFGFPPRDFDGEPLWRIA